MGLTGVLTPIFIGLASLPVQNIHIFAHLVVIFILLSVIYWVRQSSKESAAKWIIVLLSMEVLWVLLLISQLLSPVEFKEYLFSVARGFSTLAPVLWFIFVLHYTGREAWLTRFRATAIGLLTTGIFVLLITNPIHNLVVAEFTVTEEPFVHLVADPTPLQWVIFAVLYPFVIAGLLLLVDFILSTRHLSRTQTVTIILAASIAMVTNMLMPLRLGPAPGFDYSGIGTGIFGAAIGWALFNERLFQVAPVARDSIFESFSDPLIAVDTNDAIVDFNAAATELFPEIATSPGQPLPEVVPTLYDEDAEFGEEFRVSSAGENRSFRIEVSSIQAGDREVGMVLQLREVTELEAYAQELERRTQQLEVKTDQLEGFASSVSHDLRNPINVAKGRIDIARETGELENLETADAALDRGLETIDELLDLARSGQTIGDPEDVQLSQIVDTAWATVETRNATLSTELDSNTVSVDPGRVQGLFENLFRNAIEHGGESVSIRVASTAEGFTVADDGPGVPGDERDQVFDHGYTGADGTGLGLAKVESIAIAHDWAVSVEESNSGGACFRFRNVSFQ